MSCLFLCVDEPPLSVDDGMPDGWMMTGRIAGFSHDHPYEAAPIPRRSRADLARPRTRRSKSLARPRTRRSKSLARRGATMFSGPMLREGPPCSMFGGAMLVPCSCTCRGHGTSARTPHAACSGWACSRMGVDCAEVTTGWTLGAVFLAGCDVLRRMWLVLTCAMRHASSCAERALVPCWTNPGDLKPSWR